MTDSCKLVVTLSRYSTCSLNSFPTFPMELVAETSEFFAMISSLTRFMRESSFSMSTRTVRFTTGLDTAFFSVFLAGAASAFATGATAAFSVFASSFLGSSGSSSTVTAVFGSHAAPLADSISDTFRTAASSLSRLHSVMQIREKSKSNFSSSISCTGGQDTITSPSSSIALNTRKALAAFKIQVSCTFTVRPYTFLPCASASFSTVSWELSSLISCHFSSNAPDPAVGAAGVSLGASAAAGAAAAPFPSFNTSLSILINGALSLVPSSAVF